MAHFDHFANEMGGFDYLNIIGHDSDHLLSPREFDLYINESLTQKNRELLAKVKEFKRVNHFKFAWTKNGKVLLRKDDNPASQVYSFMSMANFEEFKNSRQS